MNIKKFKKDMAVFSLKQHRLVLTYLTHLEATGWTVEDAKLLIERWKKDLAKENEKQGTLSNLSIKCSECKAPMQLLPVNFTRATLTGDDSKSVWLCLNKVCLHTIYNKESVKEIIEKGGK